MEAAVLLSVLPGEIVAIINDFLLASYRGEWQEKIMETIRCISRQGHYYITIKEAKGPLQYGIIALWYCSACGNYMSRLRNYRKNYTTPIRVGAECVADKFCREREGRMSWNT
nr:hypothetical protein K-LCC10_0225 [Kaumoebavirus]